MLNIGGKDVANLKCQIGTSSSGWVEKLSGGRWSQIATSSANHCALGVYDLEVPNWHIKFGVGRGAERNEGKFYRSEPF